MSHDKFFSYTMKALSVHASDDLLLTLLVVALVVIFCNVVRWILKQIDFFDQLDSENKIVVYELIGTVESFVIQTELMLIIMDVFGMAMYIFGTFVYYQWARARQGVAYEYQANPLSLLVNYLEGGIFAGPSTKLSFIAKMLLAQALGAFLAAEFTLTFAWSHSKTLVFWSSASTDYHIAKHSSMKSWKSAIVTSTTNAAIVECLGANVFFLLPYYIQHRDFRSDQVPFLIDIGRATVSGLGNLASGGYYNPMLAFEHEYFTSQLWTINKFLVYWVAPVVGTFLGYTAYQKMG